MRFWNFDKDGGKVLLRAVLWLLLFNLLYMAANPLQYGGLPTLYNSVFPGRLRMYWSNSSSTYMVNELKISRLLADLTVARPKGADEFRVVVVASSETWGYFNRAEDTWPVVLDRMGLQTAAGKHIRAYNLAFPLPDSLKDLMITHYAFAYGFQPDLVIWAVNAFTFNPGSATHDVVKANPDLALILADRYGITQPSLDDIRRAVAIPAWQRQNFLSERDQIAYWLMNQINGLAWTMTGVDYPVVEPVPSRPAFAGAIEWTNQRPGSLEAVVELVGGQHVPLLLLSTPANYTAENYSSWLVQTSQSLDVNVLNCEKLLPFTEFTNTNLHMTPAGQQLLAEQVAEWLKAQFSGDPSANAAVC